MGEAKRRQEIVLKLALEPMLVTRPADGFTS